MKAAPVGLATVRVALRSTPSALISANAAPANESAPQAPTSATFAPARRAASAWFAPLPPGR